MSNFSFVITRLDCLGNNPMSIFGSLAFDKTTAAHMIEWLILVAQRVLIAPFQPWKTGTSLKICWFAIDV